MQLAILGDIHGNLVALNAVVDEIRNQGVTVDQWLQVGDVVGYGPEPSACIDRLKELGALVCLGNHDAAVIGKLDTSYFNDYARQAVEWTRRQLSPEDIAFLNDLDYVVQGEGFTMVHGSLHEPPEFGYVISPVEARASMLRQEARICFVGHSHVPAVYMEHEDAEELVTLYLAELETNVSAYRKVLLNVGSVGQPRDEDPRAAFALYDTVSGALSIRRVNYDIATVKEQILGHGLPEVLAQRLDLGV